MESEWPFETIESSESPTTGSDFMGFMYSYMFKQGLPWSLCPIRYVLSLQKSEIQFSSSREECKNLNAINLFLSKLEYYNSLLLAHQL